MSRLSDACDNLRGSWAHVREQWEETREDWRDAVAEGFEREVWQDFEVHVPEVLQAMTELDEVLNNALRHTADSR